jgi:hypothetical protein
MNYISKLQEQVRCHQAERAAILEGLNDLTRYLNGAKFSCGSELDSYVNVKDVLQRIADAKWAGIIAFDAARAEDSRD